jgi:16S rRNA (cytidine1402-2'-O)-methyltransferase
MASGMNGQNFSFHGYLPIDSLEKKKAVAQLEQESAKKRSAQIFIETPYRNNQLIKDLLQYCHPQTKICIAVDITAPKQWIKTKTVAQWKKETVDIHKRLAIFLLQA